MPLSPLKIAGTVGIAAALSARRRRLWQRQQRLQQRLDRHDHGQQRHHDGRSSR